jgi:outer membrane protein insertion porin family
MNNIRKIWFLIFFIFFISKSNAEIINKIEVEGNQRISLETIAIFGDIIIGNNYEAQDINSLIKKLYETSFFSNINVKLESGVLFISVKENPIINTITFNGEKAKKYIDVLNEYLTLREKTSFVKNYIKSDIDIIKNFYRQQGFYFAKIDAEIQTLEKNRVNLIYTIDKGEKAKISQIYFLGDKKLRDKKLRDIITSQENKFWKFISKSVYLNKKRIDLDKRLLVNYYKNKGYYEVDVSSSNVEYSEGEGFILTYSINAGQRYRFQKIYTEVAPELDQTAFNSLENEFSKVIGDYYSRKKITKILETIDELSQLKELQFINHKISETLVGEGVEVKIEIYEGQKFTIERINISGNSVTNDSVIRGELIVDEGDPYSALLVTKSLNRLKARGIFSTVEKTLKEGSSADLKILEIKVTEKATGEISAGAGVGTDGTSFMFGVSENNWLGRGINLRSTLNVSADTLRGGIAVINPNFNYTGNSVNASFDLSSTDLSSTSGYESSKTGISLGTEFEQYRNIFFGTALSASFEDIEAKSSASDQIKKMEGNFSNIDLFYNITADYRNQVFQPTAGYRARFTQSLPIYQDSSSILNGFDFSKYHGFSEDVIGAAKFYSRAIHGVDNDVRLSSRLYMPQNRLRGFNIRKVGPTDGGDWIGGNYLTTLGLEAQLPNLLPESTRTDVSLFLDSGNLWGVDYSDTIDSSNKLRSAFGITANVFTTVGPLSFTLAQDIAKNTNDETETFNFRLGTSF